MKEIITYSKDDVNNMKVLLDLMVLSGISNWKRGVMIAQILDSGTPAEIKENDSAKAEKEGEN